MPALLTDVDDRVEMALVTVLVVVDANTENVMDDARMLPSSSFDVKKRGRHGGRIATAHAVRQTRMQMK